MKKSILYAGLNFDIVGAKFSRFALRASSAKKVKVWLWGANPAPNMPVRAPRGQGIILNQLRIGMPISFKGLCIGAALGLSLETLVGFRFARIRSLRSTTLPSPANPRGSDRGLALSARATSQTGGR